MVSPVSNSTVLEAAAIALSSLAVQLENRGTCFRRPINSSSLRLVLVVIPPPGPHRGGLWLPSPPGSLALLVHLADVVGPEGRNPVPLLVFEDDPVLVHGEFFGFDIPLDVRGRAERDAENVRHVGLPPSPGIQRNRPLRSESRGIPDPPQPRIRSGRAGASAPRS